MKKYIILLFLLVNIGFILKNNSFQLITLNCLFAQSSGDESIKECYLNSVLIEFSDYNCVVSSTYQNIDKCYSNGELTSIEFGSTYTQTYTDWNCVNQQNTGCQNGQSQCSNCGTCGCDGSCINGDDPPYEEEEGGSNTDCAGVVNGTAYLDNCGYCVGGTTNIQECTITLTVSPSITLMENYSMILNISPTSSVLVKNIIFKIGKNGVWWNLQEGINKSCTNVRAKKPGLFKLKATITLFNGTIIDTPEEDVEINYPNIEEIKSNNTVLNNMISVWQETKNSTSSKSRSERGFWIYINTSTINYECGSTIVGPYTSGCENTNASVPPGTPSEYLGSPKDGGKYAVAFFHTHTPLSFCNNVERKVGPSTSDIDWLELYNIPGLLIDYLGNYNYESNQTSIIGGHNINDPYKIYVVGPNKRFTPQF